MVTLSQEPWSCSRPVQICLGAYTKPGKSCGLATHHCIAELPMTPQVRVIAPAVHSPCHNAWGLSVDDSRRGSENARNCQSSDCLTPTSLPTAHAQPSNNSSDGKTQSNQANAATPAEDAHGNACDQNFIQRRNLRVCPA